MTDEIEVSVDYPGGWIDLPVFTAVDADAWAQEVVWQAAAPEAPVEHLEAAAESLAEALRMAREQGPTLFVALAYQPDPTGPVLALCDVELYPFDGEPVGLDDAERQLGSEGDTVGPPEVSRRTLPAGPAVRLRRMREDPVDDGRAVVIEGVTYVLLPPALDGIGLISGRWTALVLGDELAARVDELAQRVRVTLGSR